jgi:CheY-like chemotaxis protein
LERTILESAGHELFFAGNGEVALTVLKEHPIDLVVTDLAMPEFNGLRFIKELREDGVTTPIIAISGWASDQLDLAKDYGADATLFKPVDGDELLSAVQSVLNLPDLPKRVDPWGRGK